MTRRIARGLLRLLEQLGLRASYEERELDRIDRQSNPRFNATSTETGDTR